MKELQNILAQMREIESNGAKAVLATVVDVKGSSYRLPGAKMLILETGETFGTVSGGCLEADVLERAQQILQTGEAQVVTYDTTANDDSVFALNMGCRGVIRILLEPTRDNDFFGFVEKCFETRCHGVVATAIDCEPDADLTIGTKFFMLETNLIPFEPPYRKFMEIPASVRTAILDVLGNGRARCQKFLIPGSGWVEFFIERIDPPVALVVFGAGADAVPLARFAKELGWAVTVVDHRLAYATPERFPDAQVWIARAEDLSLNEIYDRNAVAVVMTHNFERDKHALRRALQGRFRYIGVLGPKRRTDSLLQELANEGETFSDEQLKRLFAPVGLDIGADTPEAIALSIIAEINAVLANRAGGFLRNRMSSIYERS
ncbi:MAG TPA: XdhC/CoxI family protein [Pyrinomonadaceae bacterium]|nr:XdhC/CoxI family protein [Pyrinomonadaceae bacterium]